MQSSPRPQGWTTILGSVAAEDKKQIWLEPTELEAWSYPMSWYAVQWSWRLTTKGPG